MHRTDSADWFLLDLVGHLAYKNTVTKMPRSEINIRFLFDQKTQTEVIIQNSITIAVLFTRIIMITSLSLLVAFQHKIEFSRNTPDSQYLFCHGKCAYSHTCADISACAMITEAHQIKEYVDEDQQTQ